MEDSNIILIAGGTGLIGKELITLLSKNYQVRILSRNKEKSSESVFYWNPELNEIDEKALLGVTHIINLCGAGIADKRWTKARKQEIYISRTQPAEFLFSKRTLIPNLKQYISASGVNCYDYTNHEKIYTENDAMANDFVSDVVKKWEEAADLFQTICTVSKIRISMVISQTGGAVEKIEKTIKWGLGAPLGRGTQANPWIYISDLGRIFEHVITQNLEGIYHAAAENSDNKTLTEVLAKRNHKKLFLPNVPNFMMKLILGELSNLVLEGVKVSNEKIKASGFKFEFEKLEHCFSETKI